MSHEGASLLAETETAKLFVNEIQQGNRESTKTIFWLKPNQKRSDEDFHAGGLYLVNDNDYHYRTNSKEQE